MGTRCCVVIRDVGKEVVLYHHLDGYPQEPGVGSFLKNLPELLSNEWDGNVIANALVKSKKDKSYEITMYIHIDINYVYIIDCPRKTLTCYEVVGTLKDSITDMSCLEEVRIP